MWIATNNNPKIGPTNNNPKIGLILSKLTEKTSDDAVPWQMIEVKDSATFCRANCVYNGIGIGIEFNVTGKDYPECIITLQSMNKSDKLYYRYYGKETSELLDILVEYKRRQRYKYERDVFEQILRETVDETDT